MPRAEYENMWRLKNGSLVTAKITSEDGQTPILDRTQCDRIGEILGRFLKNEGGGFEPVAAAAADDGGSFAMARGPVRPSYIDLIDSVVQRDCEVLRDKDKQYGGSWMRRGGANAWAIAVRKIDRLENLLKEDGPFGTNVFKAIEGDTRPEGVMDDLRDLRRYLTLIEAEMIARGVLPLIIEGVQ